MLDQSGTSRASLGLMSRSRSFALHRPLLQRLHVRQQVVNLVGIELKLRHGRMTGLDTLGQRLRDGLDRVAVVQCPERRRDLERARRYLVDGVAPRAIIQRKSLAALLVRGSRRGRAQRQQRQRQRHQNSSNHVELQLRAKSEISGRKF